MSKSEEETIEVKLFVDNEKRKVRFAESDKDFVNVLFSFLTMPLGTVVRLLGKESRIGCLDQIYRSVEDLSSDYFQTRACKTMLLAPLNAASGHCSRLKINVDDSKPLAVYVCKDTECSACADCAFSSVPDVVCKCGKVMQYAGERPANDCNPASCPTRGSIGPGVFVKGGDRFIITDDLIVAPSSTSFMLSLFERFGVRDTVNLEQTIVRLTSEKITSLLQRSLTSKEPLTGLYYDYPIHYDEVDLCAPSDILDDDDKEDDDEVSNMKIKVLHRDNPSLLYAEVCDGFVDVLVGLLSIPIGSVIKTFGQCSGCLHNLYKSIAADAKECVKSECQSLLVSPKSAPFSGCGATRFLRIEESAPNKLGINSCFRCFKVGGFSDHRRCHKQILQRRNIVYAHCLYSVKYVNLCELNPKSPNEGNGNGEAYMKAVLTTFIVTDDMRFIPYSISNAMQIITEAKIGKGELQEKEIPATKRLVMKILRAALNRTILSSVLLPSKPKARKLNHHRYFLHY